MADKTRLILTKNVVVCGGAIEDRQSFISGATAAFQVKWPAARIFALSGHIGDSDRYLQSVRKEFPIQPPGQSKYDLGYDQLNDSYLDWVRGFKSVLVVIPEIQKLYKKQPAYFYELMGDYMAMQQELLGKSTLRFLATFKDPYPIDVEKIPVLIGGNWRPSSMDLEVVTL